MSQAAHTTQTAQVANQMAKPDITYAHVLNSLNRLKLMRLPDCLDRLAEEGAAKEWTYVEFLDHLLEAEISGRYQREVEMKTTLARFPLIKTLDQFDFGFQPSVSEKQVKQVKDLATMRFVANNENVLLLGPPGVGKTHLAISLGIAAIAQQISVYFVSISDLLDQLHRDAPATQRCQGRQAR